MIRNRLYIKREPDKDGKLYFIFCEGEKRETNYFHYFSLLASQINIQIVPIAQGKNSPLGLYENARQCLVPVEGKPEPSYTFTDGDEVWFIIDTDKWGKEIQELNEKIKFHKNWFIGESNPCFEVWLYYHLKKTKPKEEISNWKEFLNKSISGGFDSRKHPCLIEDAIENSKANYSTIVNNNPASKCTNVYKLAETFFPLVRENIEIAKQNFRGSRNAL